MKKTILLKISAFYLLLILLVNIQAQTGNCFRIGAHAGCGPYYSNEHMFLNLFMQNSGLGVGSLAVDTNGYPLQVTSPTTVRTIISSGESIVNEDSIYVVRWDGEGDFTMDRWGHANVVTILTGTYSSTSTGGRFEFKVDYNTIGQDKQVILVMTRSVLGNHVKNIRFYNKRYENLYEVQGEKYHPDYVKVMNNFSVFRYMGAFNINNSKFKSWSDRTTPTWHNQSGGNKGNGLSYEWACDFCNYTRTHMWFNVPHMADNDAIRKMAQTVYANLNPDLDIYLEYSNETWNWAAPFNDQFTYVSNYAAMIGGSRVDAHAALSKNIFKIWREVFGRDSLRVKRVLSSQSVEDINHMAWPQIMACGLENFDVWSPTYYWGTIKTNWCDINTAFNELQATVTNPDGSWYKKMSNHAAMARQIGKEMFCYEGGWGADPVDAGDYSCLSVVQALQTDPRVEALTQTVFDTLKKLGVYGGNELSVAGGWNVNLVNNLVSFWGLYNNANVDPMTFPKYAGVVNSIEECDNMFRTSDSVGAGLAFRFDGVNDYIDATPAYKPNDISESYTYEVWIRPEYLGTNQYIWSLSKDLGASSNSLYIGTDNRLHWSIKNNAGTAVAMLNGSLVEVNKWYHVLAVKSGTTYKLYVNGSEKASATGNLTGDCSRNRLFLGAGINAGIAVDFFRGRIDEFRTWNASISNLTNIRNWMCRKVTSAHPNYSNLRTYYRFDVVDLLGKVNDQFGVNDGQLKNVNYSKYSNYESSGAPVGDNSVQLYPMNWNSASLTYYHTNGDRMTVNNLGQGVPEGVHIYMVGKKPTNSAVPSTQYQKIGTYYYGVFTANGTAGTNPGYTAIYNYAGNPDASATGANNRLLRRDNSADAGGWQNSGAMLNELAQTLMTRYKRESYMGEYIIGQRPSLDKNMPGPGYALRFNGTGNATLEFKRPDDEYTVSFWVYSNSVAKGDGDWVSFVGPGYQNFTQTYYWAGGRYTFTADKYWDAASDNDLVLDQSGWNNITLVKKNDQVSMYLNGMQLSGLGPVTCGITAGGRQRDVELTKIVLGQHYRGFNGMIDEFQLWDTALDQNTIRQWMCRKITDKHPFEAKNLMLYYRFDEGSGVELENTRGPGDLILSSGVSFVASGAPIGDTSVYVYNAANNATFNINIKHPDGDYLQISKTSTEECFGAHLYRVDGNGQFSTLPIEVKSLDSTRYYGVYIIPIGYTGTRKYSYNAKYYYENNPNIAEVANTRLIDRVRNSDAAWNYNSGAPDMVNKYFSYNYQTILSTNPPYWHPYISMPHEFMLGGSTPTAIAVDTAKPAQPSVITGPIVVCSGSNEIVYSVVQDPGYDIFYVWTLPPGMAGYSDSNKVVVTVSPTASGPLGNIEVYAVNRNGAGIKRTLAVSAQLVPSLSVELTGPTEVCSGQSANYSIPAVPGTLSYQWFVPDDGSITANNGTSITAQFGLISGNVAVMGTYSCGSSLINTKAVTVNLTPRADLAVTGGRACRGEALTGNVVVTNSQIGIQYQAYKSGGTAPVGAAMYGTGMNLTMPLPLSELLSGDNVITIKAKSIGCSEVALTQTAVLTVDVAPSPNMPVVYSPSVCPGDKAIVSFPNALSGMLIKPAIKSYWRVDDPAIKYHPETGILLDDSKQIEIPPSVYHQQLCRDGINKGNNDITFTVENGSCATIALDTIVKINVPNQPRSINFNAYTWWFTSTSAHTYPWVPAPDPAQSITATSNRANERICNSDSITLTVTNAQAGVSYYARLLYRTNGQPSQIGPIVSPIVNCMVEGSSVSFTIPPYTLPITPGTNSNDFDQVQVIADGFGCQPILYSKTYEVIPGPDTTRMVVGSTVCMGENGSITIRNSQNGMTYRAYYTDPVTPIATTTGNGGDAVLTIPAATIPALGTYEFLVTVGSSECLSISFANKSVITVISSLDVSNTVKLAFDCDTTCKGLNDSIWVLASQAGVSYRAYVNGTAVGTAVIGTGSNIAIELPYSALTAYENSTVTVSVRATAGSCATNVPLTNTKQLYVNGDVDVTNSKVWINRGIDYRDGGTFMICPDGTSGSITYPIVFPSRVANGSISANGYPVAMRAVYTDNTRLQDTLLNITTSQPAATTTLWYNLSFDEPTLPHRSEKYLKVYIKPKGCPLHQPSQISGNNDSWIKNRPQTHRVIAYPIFNPNMLVINDTVCVGDVAKIQLQTQENRMSSFGADFRLYDTVNVLTVGATDNRWGDRVPNTDDGYLQLPISAPSYLIAGENKFRVQMQYSGCGSWYTMNQRGVVFANSTPDQTLAVEGTSICSGNGTAIVKNAQDKVSYQPVIGASGVATTQIGNGADLPFMVDKIYLSPGINEVGFSAKIKGCPQVTLLNKATIQVVSASPAKPSIPVGVNQICPSETNVVYSVTLDPNVSSYTWTLPTGATTTSTSNIATVNFGTSGGSITVQANNICGAGVASDPLSVSLYPAAVGGTITSPAIGCPGDSTTLTLSGHSGTIVKWQKSTSVGIWIDIFNITTTLNTGPVMVNTTYRAELQSGTCGSVYSAEYLLTAGSVPAITNVVTTDATNCGVNDGTITITATGSGTLEYSIDNGSTWQSSNVFNGLARGSYQVKVKYDVGTCGADYGSASIIVGPEFPAFSNISISDITDCGNTDGSITITATGTSGAMEYSVNDGVWQVGNIFSSLTSGNYKLSVRYVNATCRRDSNVTLSAPNMPIISNVAVTNVSNCGLSDGSIAIIASGGSGTYEYSINGGTSWQSAATFTTLDSGSYHVSIRNSNGTCQVDDLQNYALSKPEPPVITDVTTTPNTNCKNANGTVTITASGTSGVLQYSIDNKASWVDNGVITDVKDANYIVFVRYANGTCEVSDFASHTVGATFVYPDSTASVTTIPNVCSGGSGVLYVSPAQLGLAYIVKDFDGKVVSDTSFGNNDSLQLLVYPTTFTNDGVYQYQVIVENAQQCSSVLEDTATFNVSASAISIDGEISVACLNTGVLYATTASNKIYQWQLESSDYGQITGSDTLASVVVEWHKSGVETLNLYATDILTGCAANTNIIVSINEEKPLLICRDTTIEAEYDDASRSFNFTVVDTSMNPMIVKGCNFSSLTNDYNNGESLSGSVFTGTHLEKDKNFVVVWTALNVSGEKESCVSKIGVIINGDIEVPSAFSPNGDGVNDIWKIKKIELHEKAQITVFDRWGTVVYTNGNELYKGWDGLSVLGSVLPVETYHYIIDLKNGKKPIKGIVTILR